MESNGTDASILREVEALKAEKCEIESRISALEAQLQNPNHQKDRVTSTVSCPLTTTVDLGLNHGLSLEMIYRYSRHLLLPSFGVQAQSNLLKSSILVVGAGGRLGIVDNDVVELNNMHRQIIHTEAYIGRPKVESAASACHAVNSSIQIVEHKEALRTSNALQIMSQYDIVVDATDNAPSCYMISDCCVVLGKPLHQVLQLDWKGSSLFITVREVHAIDACFQLHHLRQHVNVALMLQFLEWVVAILDVFAVDFHDKIPGIIGCLQALEAIKIASAVGEPLTGCMLLFDALSARIRIVKIRGRSLQCQVCGEKAPFSKQQFQDFDYEKFTQSLMSVTPLKLNLLSSDSRISSKDNSEIVENGEPHILVDVRPEHHFKIISLPNLLNIPLPTLESRVPEISSSLKEIKELNVYVVCRRGNDSQRAVQHLQKMGFSSAKDVIGGVESWAHDVDPSFPTY